MPTNCGQYVHTCLDPHCYQCEIKRLKETIQQQQAIINFMKGTHDKSNLKKIDPDLFYKSNGVRAIKPKTKVINIKSTYFITITFDPARFNDLGIDTPQEELYILYYIALAFNQLLFSWAYGCFELQSNGTTHAHLMVHTNQPVELTQFLKESFTYNMRNTNCIKTLPSDANLQTYINKIQQDKGCERKSWFYINKPQIPYIEGRVEDYKEKEQYQQFVKIEKEKHKYCSEFPMCLRCTRRWPNLRKKQLITIFNCPNK